MYRVHMDVGPGYIDLPERYSTREAAEAVARAAVAKFRCPTQVAEHVGIEVRGGIWKPIGPVFVPAKEDQGG